MNDLPFELFVAVRYLLARRKQAFISVISLISILGVTVGVMALLIALSLMTGLQGELRDRIVGSAAHVYVFKLGEGIRDIPAEVAKLRTIPYSIDRWLERKASLAAGAPGQRLGGIPVSGSVPYSKRTKKAGVTPKRGWTSVKPSTTPTKVSLGSALPMSTIRPSSVISRLVRTVPAA